MEEMVASTSGFDNGEWELRHQPLGKALMGAASGILVELVEVVCIFENETSRNVFDVVQSVGLEILVGHQDDNGRDGEVATHISAERLPNPPYDTYVRDNPWPIPKQPEVEFSVIEIKSSVTQ